MTALDMTLPPRTLRGTHAPEKGSAPLRHKKRRPFERRFQIGSDQKDQNLTLTPVVTAFSVQEPLFTPVQASLALPMPNLWFQ